MGLFDFFKKKENKTFNNSGSDYKSSIRIAIKIFENNPDDNWETLCDKLITELEDKNLAIDLYRFIPTAYCRQFLPEPKYSEIYTIMKNKNDFKDYRFADSKLYLEIEKIVAEKFKSIKSKVEILSVLNHSSEFSAINEALHAGSKLEDLIASPPIFI